ncbi:response regulator [Phycisphaerales bacterium AB-hyl4]|uniref:Response regulator n=1 Tax=Natronomicrosphaera hydrolytica TaxID=3242702 RepID=A0ABV4U4N1_9BACT
MAASESCIDTLRLSSSKRHDLLTRLERRADDQAYMDLRGDRRVAFNDSAGLVLKVFHPGGSNANYLVRPRNLSASGIAFLHGHYLHPDSECEIRLKSVAGKHHVVYGKVMWCRHIDLSVHEVGLQFESPIVLDDFVASLVRAPGEADEASHELPQLDGRLFYVEDSLDDRDLLSFYMSQLGVTLDTEADADSALARMKASPPDLVLANVCLPGMHGLELARTLRAQGYDRPIVLLTANPKQPDDAEALAAGASAVLHKPYTFEQLLATLREHLPQPVEVEAEPVEPVLSEHWGNRRMRPLILNFVSRLSDQLARLRELVDSRENLAVLEKHCLDLRGSAGGYGYPQISEAAERLHQHCVDGASPEVLKQALVQLERLCNSASDTAARTPVQE